jgi:asparagine synthase (glutamine-hydrolysing)
MCGIAGWYRRDGRDVSAGQISAQCDTIIHRGPDDSGILTDGDFGFGMRRLSILDIEGGHQPMATAEGRFAIVFNGEIYNHLEVRKPLIAAGHKFVSHCDTETVLAGFAHWGNDVWEKLEGMFGVAVWDKEKRELTLARDPVGIKPLYLAEQNGGIAFASELRALRVLPGLKFDINERAVHDFFSFAHVAKPRSIYRQVSMLDPGHFLSFGRDGVRRVHAYWTPRFRPKENVSAEEWTEEMRTMLRETTARHMQSDVPVAAFLSGGTDSSSLVAAMPKTSNPPVKTFTISYPGAKIDETEAARETAHHLGCEHIPVPLDVHDATETFKEVQRCFDEPFADMASIPNWYVSKTAARHVKVVLDGAGGDELFAGYKRHRNARAIERYRPLIHALRPVVKLINGIPVTASRRLNYFRQYAQRFSEFVTLPDGYQQFFAATETSRRALRREIYAPEFWAAWEGDAHYDRLEQEYFPENARPKLPALEQFMLADLTVNMPSHLLYRLDRMSMAHSLEARVPLLSHKMVDWALTIPTGLQLHGHKGKRILRNAIAPWVPPSVLKRPKQGFQMPLASWMRGRFGEFAREVWFDSGASKAGYLDRSAVERLFAEHGKGEADHGRMLYAIAVFGFWWLDNREHA